MREIERNIYVDDYCFKNEYALTYGDLKDTEVYFQYHNKKHCKDGKKILLTYVEALKLARKRAGDGRYKNYDYLIYKQ